METVKGERWQSIDDEGLGFTHCGVFVQETEESFGQVIGYCPECHTHVLVEEPPNEYFELKAHAEGW